MHLQAKHWAGHDQLNDILGATSAVSLPQNTCSWKDNLIYGCSRECRSLNLIRHKDKHRPCVGVIAQVAESDGLPFTCLLGLHFNPQSIRRSVDAH